MLINTPHNPTGRIYPLETLRALGDMLDRAVRTVGTARSCSSATSRTTGSCSTAATFHSPAEVYPNTIITYSYGKTAARARDAHRLRDRPADDARPRRPSAQAVFVAQLATGYAFPNALLQHAIEDLERLSIDIGALERRRDRLVPALRAIGYETTHARGHVLRHGPLADRRRRRLLATSSPSTGARPAGARSSRSRAGSGSA